jgi:hypothetical protein
MATIQALFANAAEFFNSLLAASTSLAVPTAISFALFAQLVFVEASRAQFCARIATNGPLASFTVSAAVSLALLP